MKCSAVSILGSMFISLGLFVCCADSLQAHTPAEAMADAATRFLASLSQQQHSQTQFAFEDQQRLNWNFVPMQRAGLPLQQMHYAEAPHDH